MTTGHFRVTWDKYQWTMYKIMSLSLVIGRLLIVNNILTIERMFSTLLIHLQFKIWENSIMSKCHFLKIALLYTALTQSKWYQTSIKINFLQHQWHILYANHLQGSLNLFGNIYGHYTKKWCKVVSSSHIDSTNGKIRFPSL